MTNSSFISVRDNPSKHRFEAESQGEIAVAIYALTGEVITFVHTFVPDALRGRGIATQLVLAGLAFARDRGLLVIPRCLFFAGYMLRHAETRDLLADEGRALLGL